jgi:putative membrane protein insertion efficiency factor
MDVQRQTASVFPSNIVIELIKVYRRFVSPMLPPSCRFTPSCSEYTLEAIRKYGVLKGGIKGAWRLLRCHPFSSGGYDPVK